MAGTSLPNRWWSFVHQAAKEQDKYIRFHWQASPEGEYFEFRIDRSEITNQTILIIKDFAEKKEIKDQTSLWDHQVKELFHRLGG